MSVYMLKWVNDNGICRGGGSNYKYSLPKDNVPGEWHSKTKAKRRIEVCSFGFHATTLDKVHKWIAYGPLLYLVEVSGKYDVSGLHYKIAVENIRFISEIEYDRNIIGIVSSHISKAEAIRLRNSIISKNELPDELIKSIGCRSKALNTLSTGCPDLIFLGAS